MFNTPLLSQLSVKALLNNSYKPIEAHPIEDASRQGRMLNPADIEGIHRKRKTL